MHLRGGPPSRRPWIEDKAAQGSCWRQGAGRLPAPRGRASCAGGRTLCGQPWADRDRHATRHLRWEAGAQRPMGRKRRVSVPGPPPAVGTGGPWPGVADPLASTSTFHAAQVLFYNVNRLTSILGSEARRPLLRKTRSPVSFAMAADFLVKAPGDSPRPAAGAFAGKQAVHHFCGLAGTFPSGVGLGSTEAKSGG